MDGGRMTAEEVEAARLRALHALHALDTGSDRRFDRIVRTASLLFRAPRAAVVLVDAERLWHKARIGIPAAEFRRDGSMADLIIRNPRTIVSPDLRADPEFAPLLTSLGQVDVRFYACAPLLTPGGEAVGLLAVADVEPHPDHGEAERLALEDLASLAVELLASDAERIESDRRERLAKQRVELALAAAGLGEFDWELASDRVFISDRMKALTGIKRASADAEGGDVSYRFVHPDDRDLLRAAVEAGLREHGRYDVEYRMIRPDDGRTRWMRGAGVVVRAEDGSPTRVIGVISDITDSKAEDEHREVLLAELDHRVKNVLATVQSLATQSARKTSDTDGFLNAFSGRLKAMASAHELLTATRWRGAGLAHIATAELGGLAPGQARWEGPDIALTPRAANALSLALHELATNAVKYGALSTEHGRIEVSWGLRPDGGFELTWTEMDGPSVVPPTSQGFGSTLLGQVTGRELGGSVSIDFRSDGLRARILADASAVAPRPIETEPLAAVEAQPAATTGASLGRRMEPVRIEGMKVLIVEDAVLLALELEAGLQDAGATIVGSASELGEALSMLDRDMDAAVLDANLNGESVAPVARILTDRGIPFVFATGYGERGAPEGFDAPVVRKPYNVFQIVSALADAVAR